MNGFQPTLELSNRAWLKLDGGEKGRVVDIISRLAPSLSDKYWQTLCLPLCQYWSDLCEERAICAKSQVSPLIVSVSGRPGTGKSTLSRVCAVLLTEVYQKNACRISLDDLYLTTRSRAELAETVHPLLAHRGVPGTHDVQAGLDLIAHLCSATPSTVTALPRFSKKDDAHHPRENWPEVLGRPQIVLFDGWCWGARPANDEELGHPLNDRERYQDPQGIWRRWVNGQLKGAYRELF